MSPRDGASHTQSLEMAKRAFARSTYRPAKSPDIKTKAEFERRLKARAKPLPALELNPASHRVAAMKKHTDQQNENRIHNLRTKLLVAKKQLQQDHTKSAMKGHTRMVFEHVR